MVKVHKLNTTSYNFVKNGTLRHYNFRLHNSIVHLRTTLSFNNISLGQAIEDTSFQTQEPI